MGRCNYRTLPATCKPQTPCAAKSPSAGESILKNGAARAFSTPVQKKTVWMAFAGLVLLNLVFGILMLVRGGITPDDPRLASEALALGRLCGGEASFLHAGGACAIWTRERPDLLAGADEHAFAQAAQMPSVFRQLDHQRPFDALLLAGDATTYKPLLHHLGETKDFVLTWLDNAKLIFRRKPAPGLGGGGSGGGEAIVPGGIPGASSWRGRRGG